MANLLDKNDRAVRAFILDAVKGVNANIPIYIRNDERDRTQDNGGLVDVDTTAGPESPTGSGCYMVNVMVRAKMPAATQPDQDVGDNHALIAALTEACHNVLHQTDNHQDYQATAQGITDAAYALAASTDPDRDPQDADLANYSCLAVVHDNLTGGKPADEASISFVELINFRCVIAGVGNLR
jgi:hypothetical protein